MAALAFHSLKIIFDQLGHQDAIKGESLGVVVGRNRGREGIEVRRRAAPTSSDGLVNVHPSFCKFLWRRRRDPSW